MWDTLLSIHNGIQTLSVSGVITIVIIYVAFFVAITVDCFRYNGDFIPAPNTLRDRKRLAWIAWLLFVVTLVFFSVYW